ncbi:glycosyltransferase [Beduini massiliensis]|uniref:glycosyltransferase n=1 Tax=Beduini massiliensis TaxID=1585974 RepID=UPI00059AA7B7|nr:RecX family transcriptional regulator [Beduini massiliensis]
MKIGIFTDTYLPDINGVATSSHILRHALEKHGHEVLIVTSELPDDSDYQDEENVLRLPGIEMKKIYGYRISNIFSFKGMKEITNQGLDVIHIQTEFGIGIFGKIAAQILNLPVVYTYHTMYEDYSHYVAGGLTPLNTIVKKSIENISRIYGDNCTELIVPSEKTKEALISYGLEKDAHIIPTGLILDAFDEKNIDKEKVAAIREQYQIKDEFVVTFLGRLAPEKSVELILEAGALLKQNGVQFKMMIVGKGPSLDDLKEEARRLKIDDVVIFTGPVTSDQVPNYYHASDMFVSASITETQGLTFIEAQASGLVVLARHDKNLESVIVDGKNGFYFTDARDLAEKIKMVQAMDTTNIRHQAYLDAQQYSDDVFYEKVYKVYQLAIEHKHYSYKVQNLFPLKNNRYECVLKSDENEITFELPESIINKYGLYKGKTVERDEFDALNDHEKVAEAYQRALRFLTVKDYTKKQIVEKLNRLELYDDIQIDMTVNLLMDKNLINDEEYTIDYLQRASKLGLGINKAISNLRMKGIEDEVIEKNREAYGEEQEYETALEIVEKVYAANSRKSRTAMIDAIADKLYLKGFSSAVINKVMTTFDFYADEELEEELILKEFDKAFKRYSQKFDGKPLYNKIYIYLMRKGFDYQLIKQVMKESGYEDE